MLDICAKINIFFPEFFGRFTYFKSNNTALELGKLNNGAFEIGTNKSRFVIFGGLHAKSNCCKIYLGM
jgi:hypothetical protein